MTTTIKLIIYLLLAFLSIFFLILYSLLKKVSKKQKKPKIIFGTTPILSNKYWSNALKDINIESETLMQIYYSTINQKEDYDKYFDCVVLKIFRNPLIKQAIT